MPAINPNKPYTGTQADCTKTTGLQRLLDHFETAKVYYNFSLVLFNLNFFILRK
jgi:hypothetical protein